MAVHDGGAGCDEAPRPRLPGGSRESLRHTARTPRPAGRPHPTGVFQSQLGPGEKAVPRPETGFLRTRPREAGRGPGRDRVTVCGGVHLPRGDSVRKIKSGREHGHVCESHEMGVTGPVPWPAGLARASHVRFHMDKKARARFCQVRGNFQNSPPGAGGISQTCQCRSRLNGHLTHPWSTRGSASAAGQRGKLRGRGRTGL